MSVFQIMGKYCVVQFCKCSNISGCQLFTFPKQKSLRDKWSRFVKTKLKNFTTPKVGVQSTVCACHFLDTDFLNDSMWQMFFRKRRDLKPCAIPTICLDPQEEVLKKEPRKSVAAKLAVSRVYYGSIYCTFSETLKVNVFFYWQWYQQRQQKQDQGEQASEENCDCEPVPQPLQPEVPTTRDAAVQCSVVKSHVRSKGTYHITECTH